MYPWAVVGAVLLACAVLVGGLSVWRSRSNLPAARLVSHLPEAGGVTAGIDVEALRRGGVLRALDGSGVVQEPEYQNFVRETGFNYEQDLDYVLARFSAGRSFFLLKGRFRWSQLQSYVKAQGGTCRNTFCEMAGSTPDRRISFFPLRVNTLALAVGPESGLAWAMLENRQTSEVEPPRALLWVRVRPAAMKTSNMPAALRQILEAAGPASELQLALAPAGEGFQVTLEALCLNPEEASSLRRQLEAATRLLARMSPPQEAGGAEGDLRAVLAAGAFRVDGSRVFGRWPVSRTFAEGILGFSQ